MKRVDKLIGAELRYWVGQTLNPRLLDRYDWDPTRFWDAGGPIIEKEKITIGAPGFMKSGLWEAFIDPILDVRKDDIVGKFEGYGPTPLIAAMRAYVASKYGETVPDEAELNHPQWARCEDGALVLIGSGLSSKTEAKP